MPYHLWMGNIVNIATDAIVNVIQLFAENPQYKTMRFAGEELDHIRILGKAVALQTDIK